MVIVDKATGEPFILRCSFVYDKLDGTLRQKAEQANSILDAAGKQLQQRMLTDTEGIPDIVHGENGLMRSILTLELPYRIIMAFTYYQQFTIPQIASILNADENVIKTRLYQARMRLLHRHCPLPT